MADTQSRKDFYPLQQESHGKDTVAAKSRVWMDSVGDWEMTDALMGGTKAMRAAAETYLPKEPKEVDGSYDVRLHRTFLLNAYKDTLKSICGRPFSRPIVIRGEDKLNEQLIPISENANRAGDDLTQFARSVFKKGIHRGVGFILVDYPPTGLSDDALGPVSLRDQREQDIRPYFVLIDPVDVWGWRVARDATGAPKLMRVQIHETANVPDGVWGEKQVERVRVLYAPGEPNSRGEVAVTGQWELWQAGDDDWVLVGEGTHTFPGIPLVPFYTEQTGFLTGTPALLDLAEKNVEHWQSSSDQRNILRFVRFAMLYATGITDEEKEEEVIVGPKSILRSTSEFAKFGYVEHSGAGVEAGRNDLADLQAQMEILGLQPLVQKSGNTTATGKAMDEGKKHSSAQLWVRGLENALYEAYRMAGVWIEGPGYELPEDFKLDIHSDFGIAGTAVEDLTFLLACRKQKEIDQRTFLEEVRRRGRLHEFTDVDEIIEATGEEAQEMAAMFNVPGTDPADPDPDPLDDPPNPEDE